MNEHEENEMEMNLPPRVNNSRLLLLTALVLLVSIALGKVVGDKISEKAPLNFGRADYTGRIMDIERRIIALESKRIAPAPVTAPLPADGQEQQPDSSLLKESLGALAGSLQALEKKLMESEATTTMVEKKGEAGLAVVLAYMRMRDAALSGGSFDKERLVLRDLIGDDKELLDLVTGLEVYAMEGVAAPSSLYRQWRSLSTAALAAFREAGAKTWQDRIIIAIGNLVSIRPLDPAKGKSLSFERIDLDLEQGRIASALKGVAELPVESRNVLEPWKVKAEARVKAMEMLDHLADRLIAKGRPIQTPAVDPAENVPKVEEKGL